ncbi:hypothetical protein ACMXYX_06695 [Neptuniibacter sp. QD72_48]|uniref:hypothetical protein n=1 Tax=Neptuniibacter sp. QD72_48 TaxID=3398214 RepID=UPI0039F54235
MKLKIALLLLVTIAVISFLFFTSRTVYYTLQDPSGRYTAIISYNTYRSFTPTMPGSSSDKPGFIKIVDQHKNNLGEIPLPMLQLADLKWTQEGAEMKLIGEWNFEQGYAFYWNESGSERIFVKGSDRQ